MSVSSSSGKLASAIIGLAHDHLELFGLELDQQRERALTTILLAGTCLGCALLLLIGLSALILIFYWDNYRVEAAIGLCLFYALSLVFSIVFLRRELIGQRKPFAATLEELKRDREQLLP